MNKKLLTALSLLCVSCVTPAPTLRSEQFKQIPSNASGLIVSAEVRGGAEALQCRMEFTDGSGKNHRIFFEPGKDLYFTELEPGNYQVNRLACEHGSYYVENQPYWSRITINQGQISFFEPLKFNPANQKILIQHADREQVVDAFKQTWNSLSPKDRDRLVNAQDGKKLTDKMQDIQKVVLFHFSTNPSGNVDEFKKSVMDCEQKEMNQNHLLLGKTEYQLNYRQGKLEKINGGNRGTATFSQPFYDCIEKEFSEFRPATSTDLKVTVTL